MKQHLPKILIFVVIVVVVYGLYAFFKKEEHEIWHGYVEGEFVWVGLPEGGILETLEVKRGETVAKGVRLFGLESTAEHAEFEGAHSALAEAISARNNLLKGLRDSEIDTLLSQKEQAKAELELARLTLERRRQLVADEFASRQALDEAEAAFERAKARVEELEATLVTARLPAREDEIAAANAKIKSAQALVDAAEYRLARREGRAPETALVFDTFYEVGEFVDKGKGVVSLLPDANIKVRFYVPEMALATIHPGDAVDITCDGCSASIRGVVSFVAPDAEFTPPVIYSREARTKLVFLVEAYPDDPKSLKPGQPVDVTLP